MKTTDLKAEEGGIFHRRAKGRVTTIVQRMYVLRLRCFRQRLLRIYTGSTMYVVKFNKRSVTW